MSSGPEGKLKTACKKWMNDNHPDIEYNHYSAYGGVAGFPDAFGYIKAQPWGIPFAVEFKDPAKRGTKAGLPTKIQKAKGNDLRECCVWVFSPCDSKEDFKTFIKDLLWSSKLSFLSSNNK